MEVEKEVINFDYSRTIMGLLGIETLEFSKERVKLAMKVDDRHLQPFGLMHGGVSGIIAESVASAGSLLYVDINTQSIVGLELNMNHVRGVRPGETIYGIGSAVHVGRSTQVWEIRIVNEMDKLVCTSRCTIAVLDKQTVVTQV